MVQKFECVKVLEGHSSTVWKIIRIDEEHMASCINQ